MCPKMQSSVAVFLQLKIKRKQRFQVQRQFQHFDYDMNRTLSIENVLANQTLLKVNLS